MGDKEDEKKIHWSDIQTYSSVWINLMNRALYYKSIGDIGKYYTATFSLIISLFKEDRKMLLVKKQSLQSLIDNGGTYKEGATDELYMLCVDLLETTYLSKQLKKKEKRTEDFDLLGEIKNVGFIDETG